MEIMSRSSWKSAALPADEQERLRALARYDVLDTLPEQAYDDITELAALICHTPIALVSLVDTDRQWFKSKRGIDATETPRDIAFCSHAILQPNELFVVDDAANDPRFAGNPLVQDDPRIRFYAGAPLVTSDGYPLGTLCAIDRIPRELTPEQRDFLKALSRQVVSQLELRLKVGQLERQALELAKRQTELDEARRQQLELKDKFLRQVSHELRTPLAAIHQFLSLVLDGIAGPMNAEQGEYLGLAFKNVEQLKEMIADLLDVARAESGKLRVEIRTIGLRELILETVETLREPASASGISLRQEIATDLPLALADGTRTRQILRNLIENAIKFTPEGGSISVRVAIDPDDPAFIRFTVSDTGCGITEGAVDRIFEQLHQEAAQEHRSREGLGLGLAICKMLVDRQSGRIWAESQLGSGSTFHFTLPVFRLENVIRPTLLEDGRLRETYGLVRIALSPADPGASGGLSESRSRQLHHLLHQLVFHPHIDVVLPRMHRTGLDDVHHVLVATDAAGVKSVVRRLGEHLNHHVQEQSWRVQVHVEGTMIDHGSDRADPCDSGAALTEHAIRIEQLTNSPELGGFQA